MNPIIGTIFPEYKHSDTLCIVGMARTTRDAAPYEDLTKDMWGLNEALQTEWFKRKTPTGWFQMHPVFDFMRKYNRNDPKHWDWLKQEHPFPIFMQNHYTDVANSVAYPLREALQTFTSYFTSTPAYMLAMAIMMGYKRIEIYGIEMSADSEYIYQKAAMEYLIGYARGIGVDVYLPPECALLRANLYGYEDLRAASRVYFQVRESQAKAGKEKAQNELNQQLGYAQAIQDILEAPESRQSDLRVFLAEQLVAQDLKVRNAYAEYGQAAGRLKEEQELIHWYDTQNIPDDRADLPERVKNE